MSAPAGRLAIAATGETDPAAIRQWDALIDTMTRTGDLVLASRRPDRALPDRMHEYLGQYVGGVPVIGGGVSRQTANGATVSIFGAVFDGIDLDPTPVLSAADAAARVTRRTGATLAAGAAPALVILPRPLDGDARLTWRLPMTDLQTWFVDAARGDIVQVVNEVRTQTPDGPAIGTGVGILGDEKKVAAIRTGGRFEARDLIRPAEILTLDLDGALPNDPRFERLIDGSGPIQAQDVAADDDNRWSDQGIVDGHAVMGFTYDYFARRHGRAGIDDRNGRLIGLVNLGFPNAFYVGPPFGPDRLGVVAFGTTGEGTPMVAEDVVAHEIMHGIVHAAVNNRTGQGLSGFRLEPGPARFTIDGVRFGCEEATVFSQSANRRVPFLCRDGVFVVFANHAGTIHEAYADIFATAVEFFLHDAGDGPLTADYLIGEDLPEIGPIRSLDDPASIPIVPPITVRPRREIGYPAAYRQLLRFLVAEIRPGELEPVPLAWLGGDDVVLLPSADNGGVHWNSTILSHAFRLAIEGGMNRTTGAAVRGAGDRQAVEAAFYRALTEMLPPGATLVDTARVIHQSAVDLYGSSDDVTRAIRSALAAADLLEIAD